MFSVWASWKSWVSKLSGIIRDIWKSTWLHQTGSESPFRGEVQAKARHVRVLQTMDWARMFNRIVDQKYCPCLTSCEPVAHNMNSVCCQRILYPVLHPWHTFGIRTQGFSRPVLLIHKQGLKSSIFQCSCEDSKGVTPRKYQPPTQP